MKYYLAPGSALDLAQNSAPYSKRQKNSVLVPSLTTIGQTIILTQDNLQSFNSKKKLRSPLQTLLETTFYPIFTSFYNGWGVQYLK